MSEVTRKILAWLGFLQPVEVIGKNEAVRRMLALSKASEEPRKLRAIAETLERVG